MKLFVLFGQRKCDYPGQYSMEALACMDENGHSDNPEYLEGELAKYDQSREFDRLSIVGLSVSEEAIRDVLYPEQKPIAASVLAE
ncbi:TPA: hypothetical protein MXS07_006234 [Pseudomonas aeruginosa]|nr:hypothetical protein [Pseudomonas aeruginosa]